jgi:predicted nucleotidyltransferase component of viral defense system
MIEDEIRAEAKRKGVLPYFIEKEYLQHLFLSQLFRREGFVLRGGCCLRFVYGYERFSRSVELASSLPGEEVMEAVHRALRGMRGVDYHILSERLHEGGYEAMVECKGPLFYGASKNTNLMVISVRSGETLLESRRHRIRSPHVDYVVYAMDIREILAEKLLSLALRGKPKDAYDAWSILKRGVELDRALMERKASQLGWEFATPSPPFCDREEYEKALRNTLPSLPPYEEVMRELEVLVSRRKPVVEAVPEEEAVVAAPARRYKLWLGVVFFLGGLFAVTYYVIQEGQREAFTALYFSDPLRPIYFDRESNALLVNFTVENQEYRDMAYIYRVSVQMREGDVLVLRGGELGLGHGENVTVAERIPFNGSYIDGKLYVMLYLNDTGEAYRTIWQRIE